MAESWRKLDIILIRHGESQNNCTYDIVREKFGDSLSVERFEEEVLKLHDPDPVISKKGQLQAKGLQNYIANGGFSSIVTNADEWKIFSSPMRRCLLTCKAVSEAYDNKSVTVAPFLFESDGCFTSLPDGSTAGLPGMTSSEILEMFPYFNCMEGMEKGWYMLPKRETTEEFLERSEKIAQWLWELHSQTTEQRGFKTGIILAVHGNLIRSIISALVKTSFLVTHDNTGFTHIQLWSDSTGKHNVPSIQFVNRVDHLLHSSPNLISGSAVFTDHWMQEFIH